MGDHPTGTVTFLFTDIEGSTLAWDRHGDAMDRAQSRHDELVRAAVRSHAGFVFSSAGDGVAAAFPSAPAAASAALDVQRAVADEPWPDPLHIRVRMGLHTGTAVERDGDYFGPVVIRAARLMGLVDGGRVVCSAVTAALVADALPPGYEVVSVGSARLKGLAVTEDVHAFMGPGLDEPGTLAVAPVAFGRGAPLPATRLIGRAAEVDDVTSRLISDRLVTVTGAGGVGKTRLAIEAIARARDKYPDGVAWVELAGLTDGADAVRALADVLGVDGQVGAALIDLVAAAISGRRVLVALDNAEHVRAAVAELVTHLLAHASEVVVLVTSRERLGATGEHVVVLGPLASGSSEAPAIELLRERMDVVEDDPDVDAAVAEIAMRLDGLPLALELAAARCRTLGAVAVAERLRVDLGVVADPYRADDRHRTLERTLAWSYELLGPDDQLVLQRTSTFQGGFTLAGAAAVVDEPAIDIAAAIASLVDKSLLHRARGRFQQLETTRQFARSALTASGHERAARSAHLRFVAIRVPEIANGLCSRDEAQWVDVMDAEWADVRAAIRYGFEVDEADIVVFLLVELSFEAFFRRTEAFEWARVAYERWGERPGPHRHELVALAAQVAWVLVDIPRSVELAERALVLNPAPASARWCLPENAGIGAYNYAGRCADAVAVGQTVIEPLIERGDLWLLASMQGSLALSRSLAGDVPGALVAADRALDAAHRCGNPTAIGYAHFTRAFAALMSGDHATAIDAVAAGRAHAATVRNSWLHRSLGAARVSDATMDPTDALAEMLDIIDDEQRAGWSTHAWTASWSVPAMLLALGRAEAAAFFIGACSTSGIRSLLGPPPDELAVLENEGDSVMHRRYRQGHGRSLAEAVRVGRDDSLLPPR